MKHIRPSHLALAILAGTLLADPANAWMPMPSPPSVRPPTPPSVSAASSAVTSATGSAVRGNRDGIRAANEFTDVKRKVRAKNPKATDQQVNAAAIQVIKNRRRQEQAEWKRRDNADTNRRRAEQQAKENYNPNADVYRPSGITEQEHNDINQRSLPGKPDGTE
jgi:hypothetical protein